VVAARRNVPRGAVLSASDVELRQLEAGEENLAGTCLTSLDQALGRETKRVLRAGAPVPAADLRSVPLIRRGDLVTVRARSNGVVVRMDAKAHGDGSRGETVKLVTLDGRRELFARVVGFHEAEVAAPAQATTLGSGPMVRFMPAAAASQPLDEPRGAAPGGLQGPEGAPRAALAPLATAKRQAAQQTVDQKTHLAEP
jgi:flagella basal body P-ring formation protein FlgA